MISGIPLAMEPENVEKIAIGRKTETRRLIDQPRFEPQGCHRADLGGKDDWWDYWSSDRAETHRFRMRYPVGAFCWVKEHWWVGKEFDHLKPLEIPRRAPTGFFGWNDQALKGIETGKRRAARYMPRIRSRMTLRILEVRVERLQEITYEGARAEGWPGPNDGIRDPECHRDAARDWFMDLWDDLNSARGFGWKENPWVAVIRFKPLFTNISKLKAVESQAGVTEILSTETGRLVDVIRPGNEIR